MGLLDEAREKANCYISPKDFLCFMSYKLGEPIQEIVSFLLYNNFDELVNEYYIDRNYRIYSCNDIDCKYKTSTLFHEIAKDGFLDYMMFCNSFYDDCLEDDDADLDFYEPIEIDFYYSLEELQKIGFLKKLNLPLEKGRTLDYSVTGDDTVTAKEPKDGIRTFKLIDTNVVSAAERAKQEQSIIDEYGYGSQAHSIYKTLEMAAKGVPKTIVQSELETSNQLINDLKEQIVQLIADNKNLNKRLETLADTPADDLKKVPHQSYRTVDRVMYAMAQLANMDNSKPFSQNKPSLNASITTILQNDGIPLESEAVGKWLSRINDIKPLK